MKRRNSKGKRRLIRTGTIVASDLPVGIYSVISERSGFKTVKKTGKRLGGRRSHERGLEPGVGEVSQSVEVAATAETINTTSGELARVIDSTKGKAVAVVRAITTRPFSLGSNR